MKKKFSGSSDHLNEQPVVRCIDPELCEVVESEAEIDMTAIKESMMSRVRVHSDNIIRQVKSSRGALRIMPPATAILIVLTVILHMTIGNGAALRPQEVIVGTQDSAYRLAAYESQPYIDSDFNRNASEVLIESTVTTTVVNETETQPSITVTEESQTAETTINTQEAEESIVETTEKTVDETTATTVQEPVFIDVDQTLYLIANKVNLRSEPNTSSEILSVVSFAAQLQRTEVSDEWSYVTDTNGLSGYLMNKFLSEMKPEPTPTPVPTPIPTPLQVPEQTPVTTFADSKISPEQQLQMVNMAKSFLGVKYQTPCSAPSTFDCSGFTRYIYLQMFGIDLPYTTTGQIKQGISVNISLSDIQIGDIVCFDWSNNGSCDHVGLYIGDNQIIDASNNAGKVRQKALNIESSPILSIRRIIY